MSKDSKCPVTGLPAEITELPSRSYRVEATYGVYEVSGTAFTSLERGGNLKNSISGREHLFAAAVLQKNKSSNSAVELNSNNLDDITRGIVEPRHPLSKIDSLLVFLSEISSQAGTSTTLIPERDFPIVISRSPKEFNWLAYQARSHGYIEIANVKSPNLERVSLTLSGWERVQKLLEGRTESSKAFLAMSFMDEMDIAWRDGIQPALKKNRWEPLFLKDHNHNEKIDDKIILEIRASGIVIADLTHNRPNVYYEAGFAHALGKSVIFTCKDTHKDNLHFDIRQYNCIIWKDPADLLIQLDERIKANPQLQPSEEVLSTTT